MPPSFYLHNQNSEAELNVLRRKTPNTLCWTRWNYFSNLSKVINFIICLKFLYPRKILNSEYKN